MYCGKTKTKHNTCEGSNAVCSAIAVCEKEAETLCSTKSTSERGACLETARAHARLCEFAEAKGETTLNCQCNIGWAKKNKGDKEKHIFNSDGSRYLEKLQRVTTINYGVANLGVGENRLLLSDMKKIALPTFRTQTPEALEFLNQLFDDVENPFRNFVRLWKHGLRQYVQWEYSVGGIAEGPSYSSTKKPHTLTQCKVPFTWRKDFDCVGMSR